VAISFKRNKDTAGDTKNDPQADSGKRRFLARLKRGLSKTNAILNEDIGVLIRGKIDESLLEEIETRLLMADVGVEATTEIIDDLYDRLRRNQMKDATALFDALGEHMREVLAPCNKPLTIPRDVRPYILLVVGVNGVGKTTTIGKIAYRLKDQGLSVMLAAGDTFRAAAVEQLQAWGERNEVPVIAQESGADSASVIFDAMESARARNFDVLIADTAGRLHTQTNLMDELSKVERVIRKLDPTAPHEVMLVLDAGTGQNALNQARQFSEAVGVTGISVTKLDGTAKGGILLALARKTGIPVRFIGVGESIEDLRVFDAVDFVDALLEHEGQ